MDTTLMHWRAWGLMHAFTCKFGRPPVAPDGLPPVQLARLMHSSLLDGEVAAPLLQDYTPARVHVIPRPEDIRHPPRSDKLRKYLDDL